MFFNSLSMYSIPFICILLIIVLGLSNTRNMFNYPLHTRRKRRCSQSLSTRIAPMLNITKIPLEDDEDLMKSDVILNFCETNSIELRLEADLDSDNDVI